MTDNCEHPVCSPAPCANCGHMQRTHVAGIGRCPVFEWPKDCNCPEFRPLAVEETKP